VFDFASGRMRSAAVSFGVVPEHFAAIEESYLEFLSLFASHLEGSPFLLGGRPTVADHGFMGPLYAHLARDPYPQRLMQHNAWRVWRWVERMNRGGADAGEYGDVDGELFPDDSLTESLLALLRFVGEEYIDETIALVGAIDSHLAEHSDIVEGDIVGGKPTRRMTGEVTFSWRGRDMTVAVVPYRIFMIQRIQDALADLSTPEQDRVRSTLEPLGIGPLLDLKPRRRVNRDDNREVWGPEQEPFLLG